MHAFADDAFHHQQTGGLVALASREDLLDFGAADDVFDLERTEFAKQFLGHFVGQVIDHVVIHHPHAVALHQIARLGIRTDVETDDRRLGSIRQRHIAFGDGTHAGMQHADLDVIVGEVVQRRNDRFDRSLHIRFHNHRPFDDIRLVEHRIEAGRRQGRALFGRLFLTILRNFAGALFVFDHGQRVACRRHAAKAKDFHRHGRAGFLDLLALIVDQRADLAALRADHECIAALQRATIDENGSDRAAALVELGFDHRGFGITIRTGFEFKQLGLQGDLFEQSVKACAGLRRDFGIQHIARHLFHDHFMFEQTGAHLIGVRFRLVDLVDRHDDRDARRFGVIDGLDRLRHDAVIRGHDQNDDIGDIGPARAHFRKSGVAGRVEERDRLLVLGDNLISADMLRDPACFAARDIGLAQRVEQRGLAVIDMAHNGNDRRTRLQRFFGILLF